MGPNKKYAQNIYGAEPTTMDEMGFAIIKVLNEHVERRVDRKGKLTTSDKVKCVGLAWEITHSDMVSNSHSSPEGYPQNWGGYKDKDGVPRGYPGWSGRVWVRYEKQSGYSWGSDPFNRALAHTGTGGGGSYSGIWEKVSSARYHRFGHLREPGMYPEIHCFSWDFRIFDADWPLVMEHVLANHEKEVMWATLNNQPRPRSLTHKFLWQDPATVEADAAFIAECQMLKESENVSVAA